MDSNRQLLLREETTCGVLCGVLCGLVLEASLILLLFFMGIEQEDLQRSLPTPTNLCFCVTLMLPAFSQLLPIAKICQRFVKQIPMLLPEN